MSRTGIVLAGGAGRRMGTPKAIVRLGDRTLVEHAVAILHPHCARVLVVSRPEVPLPPLEAEVLMDGPGPDAPLTGIATGLLASDTDQVVVLACDLPHAAPLVARMLAAADDPARAVVAADPDGRDQPLCAVYPRGAALARARELLEAGRPAAMGLLRGLDVVRVAAGGDELLNLNTPEDRARLGPGPAPPAAPGAPPAPPTSAGPSPG